MGYFMYQYPKQTLTIEQQVQSYADAGMEIKSREDVEKVLKTIGFYLIVWEATRFIYMIMPQRSMVYRIQIKTLRLDIIMGRVLFLWEIKMMLENITENCCKI